MKKYFYIILLGLIMISVIVPGFVGADSHDCGTPPLLPCESPPDLNADCGTPPLLPCDSNLDDTAVDTEGVSIRSDSLPQAVPPSEIIDYIYRFGLGIGAFLAFGWIVYAGFRYAAAGDSPSVRSEARDQITQALLGLLLLVGATALLNIINSRLTNLVDPLIIGGGAPPPSPGEIPPEPIDTSDFPTPLPEDAAREQSIRDELAASPFNITVNKGACPPGTSFQRYPGGCTSVGGLQEKTIEYLKWVKTNCGGCSLVVTGGSEAGHATGGSDGTNRTHGNGWKFDLSKNSAGLSAFANTRNSIFKAYCARSSGDGRIAHVNSNGTKVAIWVNEGDHWDVAVLDQSFE